MTGKDNTCTNGFFGFVQFVLAYFFLVLLIGFLCFFTYELFRWAEKTAAQINVACITVKGGML